MPGKMKKLPTATKKKRRGKTEEDQLLDKLRDTGGLVIDESAFDPCARTGFLLDVEKLRECVEEAQAGATTEIAIRRTFNGNCLIIRIGPNGPVTGADGADVSVVDPTISNCLILLFAGNGAAGANAFVPVLGVVGSGGQDGGSGGTCTISVNQCNYILAFSGRGANGGNGQTLPGVNFKGGPGGDGGKGGDITLICQGKNLVGLFAGDGGSGGVGGTGGTAAAGISVGPGGDGGDGKNGGHIVVSVAPGDLGRAQSGSGGDGGSGGNGTSTAAAGQVRQVANGGDGGDGGNAGSIGGTTGTGITCSLGSPGRGAEDGFAGPAGQPLAGIISLFYRDGDDGQQGRCN